MKFFLRVVSILPIFALVIPACYAVEVRVRNASNVDFQSVVVGGKTYGEIKRGGITGYQTWPAAYNIATVSLVANSIPMEFRPRDINGEGLVAGDKPLYHGNVTYVLRIMSGKLEIGASIDTK